MGDDREGRLSAARVQLGRLRTMLEGFGPGAPIRANGLPLLEAADGLITSADAAAWGAITDLVRALHLYSGYKLDSRGPYGCVLDAIKEIDPEIGGEVAEHGADAVWAARFSDEPGPPAKFAWIKYGVRVLYNSSPGALYAYSGTVVGAPFLCGTTWAVRLTGMEPPYHDGKRSTVPAAACDCMQPDDVSCSYCRGRRGYWMRTRATQTWIPCKVCRHFRAQLDPIRRPYNHEAEMVLDAAPEAASPKLPPVEDQGASSNSVGHALAGAQAFVALNERHWRIRHYDAEKRRCITFTTCPKVDGAVVRAVQEHKVDWASIYSVEEIDPATGKRIDYARTDAHVAKDVPPAPDAAMLAEASEFLRPMLEDGASSGDEETDAELVHDLADRFARYRRLREQLAAPAQLVPDAVVAPLLAAALACGTNDANPDTCGVCGKHFQECETDRASHDLPATETFPACPGARMRAALARFKARA